MAAEKRPSLLVLGWTDRSSADSEEQLTGDADAELMVSETKNERYGHGAGLS